MTTGWESLLNPGKAVDYFASLAAPPRFDPERRDYCPGNAWWLAELSRTIYRRDGRAEYFQRGGFVEVEFFDAASTQCAWLAREDGSFSVLVFRGTEDWRDWLINLRAVPTDWDRGGRVHRGFRNGLREVWAEVEPLLAAAEVPVFLTGHSLGGALATLAASRVEAAAAYTFGAPRVGDAAFQTTLQTPVHRVVHGRDLVPHLPPELGRDPFVHPGPGRSLSAASRAPSLSEEGSADRNAYFDLKRWIAPHPVLHDHAPIQYVVELAALLR